MDQPDPGFGFYRVMDANVSQFLGEDLLPQVRERSSISVRPKAKRSGRTGCRRWSLLSKQPT